MGTLPHQMVLSYCLEFLTGKFPTMQQGKDGGGNAWEERED